MKFSVSGFTVPRWMTALVLGCALVLPLHATSVVPPDFAQLVKESDYVVRGTVKSVTSQVETGTNGGKKIVTLVEINVSEVIAGTPPDKVVLRLLGGTVGKQRMVVEGAPTFTEGEDNIIFVKGNGHSISPINAMMYGRYRVQHDEVAGTDYVARENKLPLHDTAEVSQPMTEAPASPAAPAQQNGALQKAAAAQTVPALTPEQFIQQIKQSAASSSATPANAN